MRINFLVSLIVFFVAGCSGMVKKPEVLSVHKIAIISVQANQRVYNQVETEKGFSFFSIPYFSNKNNVVLDLPKIPETGGYRLVDYGLNTFEEELTKINGWQVVPAIKVVASEPYKKFYKRISSSPQRNLASEIISRWYSPQGMLAADHSMDILKNAQAIKEIQDLVQELGLDAVVLVDIDLAYAPDNSMAPGRTQQGSFASVATAIKMIAKDGKVVVSTPEIAGGSGQRHFSDVSSAGLGRQINFNDEIEAMFKAAIQKSAAGLREKIIKEL